MDAETIRLIYNISLVTNVVCDGLAGVFLLFTAYWKVRSARMFANLSFALVWWSLLFFIALTVPSLSVSTVNFLIQISYVGLVFTAVSFLDLCLSFVEEHSSFRYRWARRIGYFFAFAFAVLFIQGAFIETGGLVLKGAAVRLWFPIWNAPGLLFPAYLVYFLGCFNVGFYYLIRLWFKTTDVALKKQITLIFWMTVIPAIGGSTQYLISYGIPVLPIGAFFIPVYVFGLLYAMTRFHLFNVKVLTAEIFTLTIWMSLAGKLLFARDPMTIVVDLGIFALSIVFGLFAIRSVLNEARQKERLEDLNIHLEDKVSEQTKEIREAYEVEKVARKELEKLNEAKNEFVLASQHNLRTPLTITKGHVEEIETQTKSLHNHEIQTSIDKTKGSLDILAKLVNGLIDVTDLKVGKRGFSKK